MMQGEGMGTVAQASLCISVGYAWAGTMGGCVE